MWPPKRLKIRVILAKITYCQFIFLPVFLIHGCDSFSGKKFGVSPELAWRIPRPAPGLLPGTPVIKSGSVYVPFGSELVKISLDSQEFIWRSELPGGELSGHLYADDSTIYAFDFEHGISAYRISSGDLLWETNFAADHPSIFTSLVDTGPSFLVPRRDSISKLDKETGELNIITPLRVDEARETPQSPKHGWFDNGHYCIATSYPSPSRQYPDIPRGGLIHYANSSSGEILWTYEMPRINQSGITFNQPAASCVIVDYMVIGVASGRITGISIPTGEMVWDKIFSVPLSPEADGFSQAPSSTDGELVFVGSTMEYVYALDPSSGEIAWSTKTRGSFGNDIPVVFGENLYITNPSFGETWILDLENGDVIAELIPTEDDLFSEPAVGAGYLVALGFYDVHAYRL